MGDSWRDVPATRFVRLKEVQNGQRYHVGPGDGRGGQAGRVIAIISLKHVPAYEVVLQLDNGRIDSFNPMQLFPEIAP